MMNGVEMEMPKYRCHKVVWALKIKMLAERKDGGMSMVSKEPGYGIVVLSADFVKKHNPQEGGYYVVYKDGYKSFSPAQAFEEGYTRI